MLDEKRETVDNEIKEASKFYKSERMDMSIGEIVNIFKDEELIIDPEFQRLFRWDNHQKTRLIESILVGIPIPPIFVVEDDQARWEVIDGLQRLSTIISFMGFLKNKEHNNWKLGEGDILKEIKGLTFDDLPLRAKIKIKRYIFRIEIISDESDYNIRYDLFERLNTGGATLKDQEIRNAIFRDKSPYFNEFLREMGKNKLFLDLIKISNQKEQQLFADELVLRFCSLYSCDKITKTLSKHMTVFMRNFVENNSEDTTKITELRYVFESVLNLLNKLDEDQIFLPKSKRGGFSTSIYDGIMYGLAKNIDLYKDKSPEILLKKINELKNNEEFNENMGSNSHNPDRVKARKRIANEIFMNID